MTVTPHVAQNTSGRSSAIDARTTQHGGYAVSQRVRKRIEEAFWCDFRIRVWDRTMTKERAWGVVRAIYRRSRAAPGLGKRNQGFGRQDPESII